MLVPLSTIVDYLKLSGRGFSIIDRINLKIHINYKFLKHSHKMKTFYSIEEYRSLLIYIILIFRYYLQCEISRFQCLMLFLPKIIDNLLKFFVIKNFPEIVFYVLK